MSALLALIRREPAVVTGLVQALLALLIAFGVELSAKQTGAILAVSAAVLALVVRARVQPVKPQD
ncbi:MAG: hypothetical protein J7518_20405 [Nocardioidaceae bacterium]|nr:hypothetical protein [Nocardioidaceae bacterium]